jgi:hypothetical protein
MRRSICYAEPATAVAGERRTWRFVISPTTPLPKGTLIKFDVASKGRCIDWEIPSSDPKSKNNVIWAELPGGKILHPKEVYGAQKEQPQFEFALPTEVAAGKKIIISLGTPDSKLEKTKGTLAQQTVQRRRPFYLYIDTSGQRKFGEPEVCTIDIRGDVLHSIRILAPSVTVRNRRFDVVLRFEDKFGNLTNNAPEDTLIEFSHGNLRETLKWRLFLPETGFIALPNLYFNEPGVYFLHLKNVKTGDEFRSSPIKCFSTEPKQLLWGTLHGESERFDSTENIENCLRHFRDEKSLNFYSTSSPEAAEETSPETWKKICASSAEFDEDDRFCAFVGQQWHGEPSAEGLRVFIYNKNDRQILRKKDARSSSLKKIYKLLSPQEMISIPSFTMSGSLPYNFADYCKTHERVAEIYNAWGCSEKTAKEGNTFPISGKNKHSVKEAAEGSLLQALKKNCRFGFVAGGLDDRSIFGSLYDSEQNQYMPGLTAVLCDRLSHQSVFDAVYNRSCYATTGERIVLGFTLAGHSMGAELSTVQKAGLHVNRHIAGYVAGTSNIKSIEILRNGDCIHTYSPQAQWFDFEFDDMTPLKDICLKDPETKSLFCFYYIRVTQVDGHVAWSSPIWIDCIPQQKEVKQKVEKPKK